MTNIVINICTQVSVTIIVKKIYSLKKKKPLKTLKSTVKCFLEITNAREVNPNLRH